jgi:apolipoprotein N-acyltransferase
VIDAARKGSQIILNVGSDGWFGASGEPEFHLAISRFRSIETRLPQIRAANTGISALILPNGAIAQRSALGEKQILNLEVPIAHSRETLMTAFGDWFGRVALVLAIGFVLLQWMKQRPAA